MIIIATSFTAINANITKMSNSKKSVKNIHPTKHIINPSAIIKIAPRILIAC